MAKTKKTSEAEASDNTALWNELRSTPPEYTKEFKKAGGFSGKSIDPVYRIKRLTEKFGPCGKGWGFVQEDQWSDGGSGSYVVYVRGHLWYMLDGERYQTCSHTGGTDTSRTPDEVYKMAETDALGKCCVDIGLAVDVYMGEHDGDKYQVPDSAPARRPDPEKQGRQQAGANPSNKPADVVVTPIVDAEVKSLVEQIATVKDEVDALAMSKKLFKRLLVSTSLSPEALGLLAERIIGKRCECASEAQLANLEATVEAFVKQAWIGKSTGAKNLAIVKRRLGIAPEPAPSGSLPLEG